ncbi:hypothetical protein [Actinophytocola oryzae]|uniref:Uncharacterized protein n=1 Tax=Actinophytocola oryzae TaxID=502181 RepID=A0A4R7VB57_9PSEU|nr:hypothetical protein [Actinophytocola oryzae]TDV46205.1 hypothetical protein CLV71_111163 [Actinophytocola oryzae]
MPVSDDDLRSASYALAHAMRQMLAADGLDPDIVGNPDQTDSDVFARSLEIDAELYMSMNLELLKDEYEEILGAAETTKWESDPNGVVELARSDIGSWWVGPASDAFTTQLNKIVQCIDSQYVYTVHAATAVSMMYAVNGQFRASCLDLMQKTAQHCDAVANELEKPPPEWSEAGMGLFKAAVDAIKNVDPSKIKDWAVDQIYSQIGSALKPAPVAGTAAIPVVDGYAAARDRLLAAYEDNLDEVRGWIKNRRDALAGLTVAMPDELPPCTDVDSPDFRYDQFSYSPEPQVHGPEVERERQKYVDEKPKPGGIISERLDGEG